MTLPPRLSQQLRALLRAGAFPRFLLVGVLNTLFGYGLFCILLLATGRTTLSLAISTLLGVLFNFRSIGGLVFGSSDPRRLGRFVAVYAFLFVLNAAALTTLQSLGVPPALTQAGLILPLAALSFGLNRRFVFRAATHQDLRA